MAKEADHLHRYKKVNIARKKLNDEYWVYKCQVPACTHYIPLDIAEGKLCECNRCHNPMVIDKITLTRSNGGPMKLPHCPRCIKRKKENIDDVEALTAFLAKKV